MRKGLLKQKRRGEAGALQGNGQGGQEKSTQEDSRFCLPCQPQENDWPDTDALADLIISEVKMDRAEAAGDSCAWVEACMGWFDAHAAYWGYGQALNTALAEAWDSVDLPDAEFNQAFALAAELDGVRL